MPDKENHKIVSVIVPVYNRAHYVAETIESILAQTYKNIELILINDGSTDSSLIVLQEYQRRHPDKVVIVDQENQGQIAARNNGIKKAKGEFIAFLDSDDLWYPEKLELQLPYLKNDVALVYSAIENIDQNGTVLNQEYCDESLVSDMYAALLVQNRMTGGSVVVTKRALDDVGLFDPEFKAAENWDLWLRICRKYRAALVNKVLVKYRIHPGNMSANHQLMLEAKEKILHKHGSPEPKDLLLLKALTLAKADLAYRYGLYYASTGDYVKARQSFRSSQCFAPGYKDVKQRILRTYFGKSGNALLAALKRLVSRKN